MDKFERSAKGIFGNLSEMQKELFSFAAKAAIITGVTSLFSFGVQSILDYEKALASLEAVTGQSSKLFQSQIEAIASTSKKSAIDVAKSFEVVGSAMSQYLDNPKALGQITEAGITLSKASKMELEPSLLALTSVMNQFGFAADQASNVINRLTAGEIVGSISTAKASEHLQEFGAVASANNVTLSESVALVETLGKKLPVETLGRASRNIITFMGAIKGAPAEALKSLEKHGVNLDIVSDKSLTFGERLKELSKIQGDAVAMEKFFGRENIAAGATIFQQLDTYNEWADRIGKTNEAQKQAAVNSRTMVNAMAELKNSFVNVIVSGDKMNPMLEIMKSLFFVLADNMGLVLGVVAALAGGFLLYQGALMAVNASLAISSAISNVYFLVDMVKYLAMTRGMTFGTAALAVAQESLNAAWAANPVGIVIVGFIALAAAVYGLSKAFSSLSTEEKVAGELSKRVAENSMQQRVEATALFTTLKNATQGSKAYNETLAKLEQMQPGIIEKYDLHKKNLEAIARAQVDVIANIEKMAMAEAAAQIVREKAMNVLRAKEELANPGFMASLPMIGSGIMAGKFAAVNQANQELEVAAQQQQALNTPAETGGTYNGNIDLTVRDPSNRIDTSASPGINIKKPATTSTTGF